MSEDRFVPEAGDVLFGKYQVEKVLGQGGMGIVVAARHLALDERVAIKFLLPSVAGNSEAVNRFLREARAAVKIRSEHVARVIDVGTMENGAPYIVMEFLSGNDLSEVLDQSGPLPVSDAVDYVLQACEALAQAHALGIIHRDIKPANLFRTTSPDGSPCIKLLDFGISKVLASNNQELTRTRGMMGSPLYMSPEQLNSARDVDPRSDVYSLGVVLYELLTGRLPFEAEELPQLVVKILSYPPTSAREFVPHLPPELDEVIARCIAKDRNARIQTVSDLARALSGFASARGHIAADKAVRITNSGLSGSGAAVAGGSTQVGTLMPLGATTPPPARAGGKGIFAMGALVVVAAIATGAFFLLRGASTPAPRETAASPSDRTEEPNATVKGEKKLEDTASPPLAFEEKPLAGSASPTASSVPSTALMASAVTALSATPPKAKPATVATMPAASANAGKTSAKPSATGDDPFGKSIF